MRICKKLTVIQLIRNSNVVGYKCKVDDVVVSCIKSIQLSNAYATLTLHNESELFLNFEDFVFNRESI